MTYCPSNKKCRKFLQTGVFDQSDRREGEEEECKIKLSKDWLSFRLYCHLTCGHLGSGS